MDENQVRNELVRLSKSLFDRGYSVGSAGNVSVAVDGGYLVTPTNSSLGNLDAERISKIDAHGRHISGNAPSKEVFLHLAFYRTRPTTGAVVHLHSTFATALSCMSDVDPDDCVPPLTPYVVMRVGKVKLVDYVRPGDARAGDLIGQLEGKFGAVLLANHGPVIAGRDLQSAVYAAEELEETAKLLVLLRGLPTRMLNTEQVQDLIAVFGK